MEANDRYWLKALIHRVDSHVYWTAIARSRTDSGKAKTDGQFKGLVSEDYIFLDLLRRSVVSEVQREQRNNGEPFSEGGWRKIRQMLKAPYAIGKDTMLYKLDEPPPHFWYQIDIDGVSADNVVCDITWQGYKNRLSGLVLRKPLFYKIADGLKGRLRFRTDWASMDEAKETIEIALKRSTVLECIRADLEEELRRLDEPSPATFKSVCSNVLPLLEKLLRDIRKKKGWVFSQKDLGQLVGGLNKVGDAPYELVQLLDLIVRPYRNYVQHGNLLTPTVAKMLLVTALEAIVRLADYFEQSD